MKPQLFEQCRTYLLAHALSPKHEQDAPPLRAVTISRETGAGAITVGKLLMEYLESKQGGDTRYPWAVFDRDLVKRVLKDHRLPEALESYMPEDSKCRGDEIVEELLGVRPSTWALVQHTNRTILRLGNLMRQRRGTTFKTDREAWAWIQSEAHEVDKYLTARGLPVDFTDAVPKYFEALNAKYPAAPDIALNLDVVDPQRPVRITNIETEAK